MCTKWESTESLKGKDTSIVTAKRLLKYGSMRKRGWVSGLNGSGWGGDEMKVEAQQSELVLLNEMNMEELAKVASVTEILRDIDEQRAACGRRNDKDP